MKIKFNPQTILLFLLFICSFSTYGQYNIFHYSPNEREDFKKRSLYVALGDKDAAASKPYIDMIKNSWTNSEVQFINYDDIEKHTAEHALFLWIDITTSTSSTNPTAGAGQSKGLTWSNTYYFLTLWQPVTGKKGKFEVDPITRISIFTDYASIQNPSLTFNSDYSKEGHIRNWSVGILKNYIQTILMIMDGKAFKLKDYRDKPELDKLKTETLYIPDYTFINFDKWTGDETKRFEVTDLMKDYEFQYKVVTSEELSQKILNEQNPIYYFLYVKNSTTKYISVINSQTGKIVYAYGDMEGNYNIKPSDLKDLSKAIKK
ncbi:MAG: hypothetical protein M0D53_14445 [Flavobacterium sp. JAD_PAG50586_2]|nr:MAG: hypothetical protein M0D53_14445 [Flavobacterium sp. JAD_PAG50586_2]